ncbi:hypothetical protein [Halomonas sp. I5-271120]|uniref:hypothetical protein n=1 Tax=Halomonas sp. I5-271120 TaxID=3061632 RepID=UPI002714813F|nr:hypothetical protein [Halomonas sp. I5-271120]
MSNEPTVKRWTAKRKAAVVMDTLKGKTTVAEVASSTISAGSKKPSAAWKRAQGPCQGYP